jgi:D-galactarolactone cycloisomerase
VLKDLPSMILIGQYESRFVRRVAIAPHSAYFGAGLIATAHLAAALGRAPMVERLYCDLTESPFGDWYEPVDGHLAVPQGTGLGIDPDPAILEKLRVA